MRPLYLNVRPFCRTIADPHLEGMGHSLPHLKLDVQGLVSCFGVECPWGYSMKHSQVVDRIGTGRDVFIGHELPLVDGELATYSVFLNLLFPFDGEVAKRC